jgi:hypothetical protein
VAVHVVPPTVLAGDFFPNSTFENGAQLDNPTLAVPAGGWQRGGSSSSIDQVTTNNSVSHTHSLTVLDNDTGNYGEWYLFMNLSGLVTNNDVVDIQYYQLYSITNGNMRLSFAFLDAGNNTLFGTDFNVTGQSPGWLGTIAGSPFQQQSQRLLVPVGTTQLRVNFASGGSSSVTGQMLIDDLSVRLSLPYITAVTPHGGGFNLTWNSMPSKNYTVSFTSSLSGTPTWTSLATHLPGAGLIIHSGHAGYYRIVQE